MNHISFETNMPLHIVLRVYKPIYIHIYLYSVSICISVYTSCNEVLVYM